MKRIIVAGLFAFAVAGLANAQTDKKAPNPEKEVKEEKKAIKKNEKAENKADKEHSKANVKNTELKAKEDGSGKIKMKDGGKKEQVDKTSPDRIDQHRDVQGKKEAKKEEKETK